MRCRQCGAELPDEAKFCLQCGTSLEPEPEQPPPPQAPLPDLDFIQPALSGGMFLGLLSSIPVISAGNLLCCMWVLLGGGAAAVLLTRQRPLRTITYGDGAFAGVLSGFFGAIIGTAVQVSFDVLLKGFFESQRQQIETALNQIGAEGALRDLVLRVASGEVSLGTVLFIFLGNLLAFALFAMIGGILAIAILKKREATKST